MDKKCYWSCLRVDNVFRSFTSFLQCCLNRLKKNFIVAQLYHFKKCLLPSNSIKTLFRTLNKKSHVNHPCKILHHQSHPTKKKYLKLSYNLGKNIWRIISETLQIILPVTRKIYHHNARLRPLFPPEITQDCRKKRRRKKKKKVEKSRGRSPSRARGTSVDTNASRLTPPPPPPPKRRCQGSSDFLGIFDNSALLQIDFLCLLTSPIAQNKGGPALGPKSWEAFRFVYTGLDSQG